MKYKYWAVGGLVRNGFEYNILAINDEEEPPVLTYFFVDGPFDNIGQAKRCIKDWVSLEKARLQSQLEYISSLSANSFKSKINK